MNTLESIKKMVSCCLKYLIVKWNATCYRKKTIFSLKPRPNLGKTRFDVFERSDQILIKLILFHLWQQQDIVEFLNIKVGEHEKLIYSLETKAKRLETENQQMSQKTDFEIGSLRSTTQAEIDSLGQQCSKYKAELNDLAEFAEKKVHRMTQFPQQQVIKCVVEH